MSSNVSSIRLKVPTEREIIICLSRGRGVDHRARSGETPMGISWGNAETNIDYHNHGRPPVLPSDMLAIGLPFSSHPSPNFTFFSHFLFLFIIVFPQSSFDFSDNISKSRRVFSNKLRFFIDFSVYF